MKPLINMEVVDPAVDLLKPERLKKIISSSSGFLLVYDVNKPESLTELVEIRKMIDLMTAEDRTKNRVIYIVGNKSDLINKTDEKNVKEVINKIGAVKHYFISANNQISNIERIFKEMYENMIESQIDQIE